MERNWKWFVPVVLLVFLLMAAGFFGLAWSFVSMIDKTIKTDPVYIATEAKVRSDPRVIATLGEPLRDGAYINIRTTAPSRNLQKKRLGIELVGPKNRANVVAEAEKSDGQWNLVELQLVVEKTGQQIDLLKPPPPITN